MTDAASATPPRAPVPVQDAILDEATVDELFYDLAHTAQLIAVMEKPSRGPVGGGLEDALWQAHQALRARRITAVQLRYRFAGEEWWDTLMRTEAGLRLVRISHTRAAAAG